MEIIGLPYSNEIVLNFSLNKCKNKHDYSIEFSLDNHFKEFERIKCKSENSFIEFSESFPCKYYFYKIQNVTISVTKWEGVRSKKFKFGNERCPLTLSTIVNSKNSEFKTKLDENNSEIIIIKVTKSQEINKYIFCDFIREGISFDGYISIDFSDKKYHLDIDMENNQYMKAIEGFRETLYDFVKYFDVFGYGAKLKNNNNNNPYFNLSLNEDPSLKGLTNIKKAYIKCLEKIDFSFNKNILSSLIQYIEKIIFQKYNLIKYNIFFLLINKAPDDYQKCIDAFIKTSYLPLSIIIIGIGDNENEFNKIIQLFKNKKQSSNGMEKQRNNIFFISMKECNYQKDTLKNICLKDIPMQVVEYYKLANTTPEQIRNGNLENIKESLKILDLENSLYQNYDNKYSVPPLPGEEAKEEIINSIYLIENNYNNTNINNNENIKNISNIEEFCYNKNNKFNQNTKKFQNTPQGNEDNKKKNINKINPYCKIIKHSVNTLVKEKKIDSNEEDEKKLRNKTPLDNEISINYKNKENPYINKNNNNNSKLNKNKIKNSFNENKKENTKSSYYNTPGNIQPVKYSIDNKNNNSTYNKIFLPEPSKMENNENNKLNTPHYNKQNNENLYYNTPGEEQELKTIINNKESYNNNLLNYEYKRNQLGSYNPISKESTLNSINQADKNSTILYALNNGQNSQVGFTSSTNSQFNNNSKYGNNFKNYSIDD